MVIGSTKANYPYATIVQTKSNGNSKNDSSSSSQTVIQSVADLFTSKRIERLDAGTQDELLKRYRRHDRDYMSPMIAIAIPLKNLKMSIAGLSKALVNFYIQQRQRTTPDWKMFNHQDQKAKSYYVVSVQKEHLAPNYAD